MRGLYWKETACAGLPVSAKITLILKSLASEYPRAPRSMLKKDVNVGSANVCEINAHLFEFVAGRACNAYPTLRLGARGC